MTESVLTHEEDTLVRICELGDNRKAGYRKQQLEREKRAPRAEPPEIKCGEFESFLEL